MNSNPFYDQFKLLATRGSGLDNKEIGDVYRGVLHQRGFGYDFNYGDAHGLGFGSTFMKFIRFLQPSLKSGLKYLGNQAVSTAANIATDALAGRDIRESAKEHARKAGEDIFARAPAAISQLITKRGGMKRRRVSHQRGRELSARPAKRKRHFSGRIGKGLLSTYPVLENL